MNILRVIILCIVACALNSIASGTVVTDRDFVRVSEAIHDFAVANKGVCPERLDPAILRKYKCPEDIIVSYKRLNDDLFIIALDSQSEKTLVGTGDAVIGAIKSDSPWDNAQDLPKVFMMCGVPVIEGLEPSYFVVAARLPSGRSYPDTDQLRESLKLYRVHWALRKSVGDPSRDCAKSSFTDTLFEPDDVVLKTLGDRIVGCFKTAEHESQDSQLNKLLLESDREKIRILSEHFRKEGPVVLALKGGARAHGKSVDILVSLTRTPGTLDRNLERWVGVETIPR